MKRSALVRPPLVAAAVGVALSLGGCSEDPGPRSASSLVLTELDRAGEGVVPSFCFAVEPIMTGTFLEGVETMTSAESAELYAGAVDDIEAVVAPSEIEDDWATFSAGMVVYLEGMAATDPASGAAAADIAELAEAMTTDEISAARVAVEEYTGVYCGPIE